MSIKRRTSDTFRVVSLTDDALQSQVPIEVVYRYEMSRNLDDLPLATMEPQPLIVTMAPLKTLYENVARQAEDGDAHAAWFVFAKHAVKFENDLEDVVITHERDGGTTLPDDLRASLPPAFVQEMAGVLVQRADRGALGPFSSRVGWRDTRSTLITLTALSARGTAPAKKPGDATN